MIIRFLIFGVIGWCLEILWTGLGSLVKGDFKLESKTSIWMFFIYGCGALFQPVIHFLVQYPWYVRGFFYVIIIFLIEFAFGYIMQKFESCPWDYSHAKLNVMGIIRWDYAPLWFMVGLLFEFTHLRLDGLL